MYFVVTVYSTFGRGSTGVSVFVLYLLLWVVLFSFILSHWEKYNTGILFLPWGYDISQVVSTRRSGFSRSSMKGWRARGAALVPVQPPVNQTLSGVAVPSLPQQHGAGQGSEPCAERCVGRVQLRTNIKSKEVYVGFSVRSSFCSWISYKKQGLRNRYRLVSSLCVLGISWYLNACSD